MLSIQIRSNIKIHFINKETRALRGTKRSPEYLASIQKMTAILVFEKSVRKVDKGPKGLISDTKYVRKKTRTLYLYQKADMNSLKRDINKIPTNRLENMKSEYNFEDNWIFLKNTIKQAADTYCKYHQRKATCTMDQPVTVH